MRCKLRPLPVAILAGIFLAAGVAAEEKADAAKKPAPPPLVRVDLLKTHPADPAAPIRDIFSPGRAVAAPESVAPDIPDGEESGLEGSPDAVPEKSALDLVYIGWVTSGQKVVALVISEGQTLAVIEGEEIIPGLKVDKIALDRIEVIGPGGKRTSVPVQGEQP
jgi:hypothetical protein